MFLLHKITNVGFQTIQIVVFPEENKAKATNGKSRGPEEENPETFGGKFAVGPVESLLIKIPILVNFKGGPHGRVRREEPED